MDERRRRRASAEHGSGMRLRLAGDLPTNAFPRPTIFKVLLNGKLLDEFTTTQQVQRDYTLTAAQLGTGEWSELRLQADQSITPQQQNPKSRDDRPLSFSLTELVWEEALTAEPDSPKPAHK